VPAMDDRGAWRLLRAARVGVLATTGTAGRPHAVPFVFAVRGRTLYWTVDDKPKLSPRLQRLRNIEANPKVEVLVHHYDEDWETLWWVRAWGVARIVVTPKEAEVGFRSLARKYPRYRERRPMGPVVAVALEDVTGWRAGPAVAAGPNLT
jgi:PPOX class probable F420-dependent enzyme